MVFPPPSDIIQDVNSGMTSDPNQTALFHLEGKPLLEKYLMEGEILVWCDKPQVRWTSEIKRVLPLIGIVLVIFFFALVNYLNVNARVVPTQVDQPVAQSSPETSPRGKVPLTGIIFISAVVAMFLGGWCYFVFKGLGGNKLLSLLSLSRTRYGLTDRRLLLVVKGKESRVVSFHLLTTEDFRLSENADGTGTIQWGPKDRYKNPFVTDDIPAMVLRNIAQPARVFQLICEAQDRLLRR